MPAPAVIRLSSPGRTMACTPALSRCSTSPLNSQLTVCRPVCGCGGTSMPGPRARRRAGRSGRRSTRRRSASVRAAAASGAPGWRAGRQVARRVDEAHRRMVKHRKRLRQAPPRCCSPDQISSGPSTVIPSSRCGSPRSRVRRSAKTPPGIGSPSATCPRRSRDRRAVGGWVSPQHGRNSTRRRQG